MEHNVAFGHATSSEVVGLPPWYEALRK